MLPQNLNCSDSILAPDDVSTPQNLQLSKAQMFRARRALSRAPLFVAHNASTSPELRPTSGLTPRVASRVATQHTPGIIFAQPARRPPRRAPRTFRHQTNSFSFDSSERASAAYEQELVSSTSTLGSVQWPPDSLSLHEELRGSSLESSRAASVTASSSQLEEDASSVAPPNRYATIDTNGELIFSAPQFPLPPPFSTVSRSLSRADSLPSSTKRHYPVQNPSASQVRSPSGSPLQRGLEGRRPSASRELLEHEGEVGVWSLLTYW